MTSSCLIRVRAVQRKMVVAKVKGAMAVEQLAEVGMQEAVAVVASVVRLVWAARLVWVERMQVKQNSSHNCSRRPTGQ